MGTSVAVAFNMKSFHLVYLFLLGVVFCRDENDSIERTDTINTESGPVRGIKINKYGMDLYGFLGIPYAEPPVGSLRFQPPKPISSWIDVLDADKNGPQCLQVSEFLTEDEESSEDCLTLNVFTNNIGTNGPFRKKSQPVMVWIHGGGFTIGSKDLYRMDELLTEDVVYVAMNCRLAALGFMSFGNDVVSGNMGLKDQQLAIQWIRYNIHHFGGDPNKITIFGESAGAISVQAHVLSPWNSGILSGAIAQSGSILNLHFKPPEAARKYGLNVATALGCPTTFDENTLNCMQSLDMEEKLKDITDSEAAGLDPAIEIKFWFFPDVDNYALDPFIPMDPLEAVKSGMFNRVPYMSGTNTNEGVLTTGRYGAAGITGSAQIELIQIPAQLGFEIHYGQDQIFSQVALQFYNHTTGDSRFEGEKPFIDFTTDYTFLSSDQKSVELMSGYVKNVFNYHLSQPTNSSLLAQGMGLGIEYTPTHADDLNFLVSPDEIKKLFPTLIKDSSEDERATSKHMRKYWTNFAKYGIPTGTGVDLHEPAWYPVKPNQKNYLDINSNPEMKEDLSIERMYFWDKMVWEKEERMVEKKQLYTKATQILLSGYNAV